MATVEQKTPPERPFRLEFEDAKSEIFTSISEIAKRHNIPYFLLDGIITEVLYQVKDGAREESRTAEFIYQKQLEQYREENQEKE